MAEKDEDLRMRFAAGETEAVPPAPSTAETVRKDMTYSPASETETERKQENPCPTRSMTTSTSTTCAPFRARAARTTAAMSTWSPRT